MKITEKCRINILKKEIFIQLKIKKSHTLAQILLTKIKILERDLDPDLKDQDCHS